jgi:hypothetical protein
MLGYLANELRSAPAPILAAAPELDSEPPRLLKAIYELQTRLDLYKLVVARDGTVLDAENLNEPKGNLIETVLGAKPDDVRAQRALEKLILEIPDECASPNGGNGDRLLLSRRELGLEAPDGLVFRIVGLEDGEELGEREQLEDPLRQVEQLQAAALEAHSREAALDLAVDRRIDIGDVAQVQEDLRLTGVDQPRHRLAERIVAFADQDLSVEVEDDHVTDLALDDLHEAFSPGLSQLEQGRLAYGVED